MRARREPALPAALLLALALLAGCAAAPPAPAERKDFQLRSFEPKFGYTQAVKVGRVIHVSGSVSMDLQGRTVGPGDMRTQVRQAYEVVRQSLAFYGADFSHVVKETVHTTDMDAFLKVTDERAKFYAGTRFPAASWIGVPRLVSPEYLVEVGVEAVLPE